MASEEPAPGVDSSGEEASRDQREAERAYKSDFVALGYNVRPYYTFSLQLLVFCVCFHKTLKGSGGVKVTFSRLRLKHVNYCRIDNLNGRESEECCIEHREYKCRTVPHDPDNISKYTSPAAHPFQGPASPVHPFTP